jgi:hypothetical protein
MMPMLLMMAALVLMWMIRFALMPTLSKIIVAIYDDGDDAVDV